MSLFQDTDNTATSSLNKLVNDYIYYYEKGLRANKFGIPAGVFSSTVLPEKVEAFYNQEISKDLSLAALNAVINFFNGTHYNGTTSGSSFSDYLVSLDNSTLSQSINSQFTVAKTQINNLDVNFYNQINSDNTQMTLAYDELQKVVVLLKVDMLQAFNISVDYVDADGD